MDAFSTLASQHPMAAAGAVAACMVIGLAMAVQRQAHRRASAHIASPQRQSEHLAARQALTDWMETLQALEAPLREGDRPAVQLLLRQHPMQAPAALVAAVDNPAFPIRDAESVLRLIHLADDIATVLHAERDLLDQRRALEAFLRSATILHQALSCAAAGGNTVHAPPEVAVGV